MIIANFNENNRGTHVNQGIMIIFANDNMTKEEIKHRDELGKVSGIISELGFVPNESKR